MPTTETANSSINVAAAKTVEIYDTTLRDGAQQEGISLSVEDKLAITRLLDDFGIDVIEGGYAGATPKDHEYFERVRDIELKHAQIAAFGNTRRADADCDDDITIQALLQTEAPITTIVGKASEYQVRVVLETTVEENLAMIADSVSYLKSHGRRVFYDAEHFFRRLQRQRRLRSPLPALSVRCGGRALDIVRHQWRYFAKRGRGYRRRSQTSAAGRCRLGHPYAQRHRHRRRLGDGGVQSRCTPNSRVHQRLRRANWQRQLGQRNW